MVFSSLEFILLFMPIFFGIYYIVPKTFRNFILFIGSLIFYFIGTINNPEHYTLFIISMIVDFSIGLILGNNKFRYKKIILTIGIMFHILSLTYFKYFSFLITELQKFIDIPSISIILPIGISFYTFQGISYLIDVYHHKISPEKSLLRYCVYISMFEQLIAGPIVTYPQVKKQLQKRIITSNMIKHGLYTFIFGLGLKVLLANPLGKLWSQVVAIGFESITTPLAWLAIIAFSFQIYFDFFGYSLMAIGLGEMLGFTLPTNFNHPYTSRSMSEFWRRWHITLGSWFREYVYISLGGNKHHIIRNLLIVWSLTGIWHGAGYNFILWGLFLFILITSEKLFIGEYLKKHKLISYVYMFFTISISWSIFAIDDINQLPIFLNRLFPIFETVNTPFPHDYLKYLKDYYIFFIVGCILSFKLPYDLLLKINNKYLIFTLSTIILLACIYCMHKGLDDPFLYFRF